MDSRSKPGITKEKEKRFLYKKTDLQKKKAGYDSV